jgi:hypothetical protein
MNALPQLESIFPPSNLNCLSLREASCCLVDKYFNDFSQDLLNVTIPTAIIEAAKTKPEEWNASRNPAQMPGEKIFWNWYEAQ